MSIHYEYNPPHDLSSLKLHLSQQYPGISKLIINDQKVYDLFCELLDDKTWIKNNQGLFLKIYLSENFCEKKFIRNRIQLLKEELYPISILQIAGRIFCTWTGFKKSPTEEICQAIKQGEVIKIADFFNQTPRGEIDFELIRQTLRETNFNSDLPLMWMSSLDTSTKKELFAEDRHGTSLLNTKIVKNRAVIPFLLDVAGDDDELIKALIFPDREGYSPLKRYLVINNQSKPDFPIIETLVNRCLANKELANLLLPSDLKLLPEKWMKELVFAAGHSEVLHQLFNGTITEEQIREIIGEYNKVTEDLKLVYLKGIIFNSTDSIVSFRSGDPRWEDYDFTTAALKYIQKKECVIEYLRDYPEIHLDLLKEGKKRKDKTILIETLANESLLIPLLQDEKYLERFLSILKDSPEVDNKVSRMILTQDKEFYEFIQFPQNLEKALNNALLNKEYIPQFLNKLLDKKVILHFSEVAETEPKIVKEFKKIFNYSDPEELRSFIRKLRESGSYNSLWNVILLGQKSLKFTELIIESLEYSPRLTNSQLLELLTWYIFSSNSKFLSYLFKNIDEESIFINLITSIHEEDHDFDTLINVSLYKKEWIPRVIKRCELYPNNMAELIEYSQTKQSQLIRFFSEDQENVATRSLVKHMLDNNIEALFVKNLTTLGFLEILSSAGKNDLLTEIIWNDELSISNKLQFISQLAPYLYTQRPELVADFIKPYPDWKDGVQQGQHLTLLPFLPPDSIDQSTDGLRLSEQYNQNEILEIQEYLEGIISWQETIDQEGDTGFYSVTQEDLSKIPYQILALLAKEGSIYIDKLLKHFPNHQLACIIPCLNIRSLTSFLKSIPYETIPNFIIFASSTQKRVLIHELPLIPPVFQKWDLEKMKADPEKFRLIYPSIFNDRVETSMRALEKAFTTNSMIDFSKLFEEASAQISKVRGEAQTLYESLPAPLNLDEPPDFALDQLTFTPMENPIKLPVAGSDEETMWIDQTTLDQLLQDPKNIRGDEIRHPFNKEYFPRDQFITDASLKGRIDEWQASRKRPREEDTDQENSKKARTS